MNPAPLIRATSAGRTRHNQAMVGLIPMLAHEGGWDEALLVGLPLVVIGLLLWVANRRVSAQLADATLEEPAGDGPAADGRSANDAPDAP